MQASGAGGLAPGPRLALALGMSLLAFTTLYLLLGRPQHGIDDSDITAVYARNIAHGEGYVYTPSGERVEGSTSLAWTLLSALSVAAGAETGLPLFAVSVLLCALAIYACASVVPLVVNDRRAQWAMVLVLGACPPFFVWTLATLMDSALWCASVGTALLLALLPRSRRTAIALPFALAWLVLVRPEAMVVAPALAVMHGLAAHLRGAPRARAAAAAAWPLLACVVATAGLVGFRLSYFGFPFPNTYYAKVGGDHLYHALLGLHYDVDFLLGQPLHGVALAIAIYTFLRDTPLVWRRLRGGAALAEPILVRWLVALFVFGGLALPLVDGGDHFWGGRLLQPFAPWLALLLAAWLAARLPARLGARARLAWVALGLACVGFAWFHFITRNLWVTRHEIDQATRGRRLADLVESSLPPGSALPSVGVTAAGGFAYGYAGRTVDLMGLNWVAMAHSPGDRRGYTGHAAFSADVFWSAPPDLVSPRLLANAPADECEIYFAWDDWVMRGMLSSERFRQEYSGLSLPTSEGVIVSYAHRTFLAKHPELAARAVALERDCAAERKPPEGAGH